MGISWIKHSDVRCLLFFVWDVYIDHYGTHTEFTSNGACRPDTLANWSSHNLPQRFVATIVTGKRTVEMVGKTKMFQTIHLHGPQVWFAGTLRVLAPQALPPAALAFTTTAAGVNETRNKGCLSWWRAKDYGKSREESTSFHFHGSMDWDGFGATIGKTKETILHCFLCSLVSATWVCILSNSYSGTLFDMWALHRNQPNIKQWNLSTFIWKLPDYMFLQKLSSMSTKSGRMSGPVPLGDLEPPGSLGLPPALPPAVALTTPGVNDTRSKGCLNWWRAKDNGKSKGKSTSLHFDDLEEHKRNDSESFPCRNHMRLKKDTYI